jgi:hypothetical protein
MASLWQALCRYLRRITALNFMVQCTISVV